MIPWNHVTIPWNHAVILVLSCRSYGFSGRGEAFIMGSFEKRHGTRLTPLQTGRQGQRGKGGWRHARANVCTKTIKIKICLQEQRARKITNFALHFYNY
jgi:hypothetical protein